MSADQVTFAGTAGQGLEAIAARLSGGTGQVGGAALMVRPGIEVRGTGDLKIGADWNLPAAAARDLAPHAGDTSLTVRAPGALTVAGTISTGYGPNPGGGVDIPASDRSGSITLVAGAAVSAADPTRTSSGSTATLLLGDASTRTTSGVALRTTTGDIALHAAGDIRWVDPAGTVTTAGRPVDSPVDLQSLGDELATRGIDGTTPFLADGGSIRLSAGQDILGAPVDASQPGLADWWWRARTIDSQRVWWSRADLFTQGVASFGGGSIRAQAGRDIVELRASAPGNGLIDVDGAVLLSQRGGSVEARAGRDIVNGALAAGGATLDVAAGGAIRRDVAALGTDPGLQLVHEGTAVRVHAAGDVTLGSVRSAGDLQPAAANISADMTAGRGFANGSALAIVSAAGDVDYRAAAQVVAAGQGSVAAVYALLGSQLPSDVLVAAPGGSVHMAGQNLVTPGTSGGVALLARDDLSIDSLALMAAGADAARDVVGADAERTRLQQRMTSRLADDRSLDASNRSALHVAAEQGDLTLTGTLDSVRPLRLVAGDDLRLGASARVIGQHQAYPVGELTLLQAGRDIVSLATTSGSGTIEIGGPGDLLLIAGRHIDLGASRGITATGNRDNPTALADRRAVNVTLVAGLRGDAGDYQRAAHEGFALLGAAPLADGHAGDLYALLSGKGGGVGSDAARAFAARSTSDQLASVRDLLGAARQDALIADFVRSQPGHADLSDAAALSAFAMLPESSRRLAVGAMLTHRFGELPQAQRAEFVAAMAASDTSAAAAARRADFLAFVAGATGERIDDLRAALVRFEALPSERQAVWLNRVLVDEVRHYGREASVLGGAERDAAYARGYLSLDALFPVAAAGGGDIRLPTSQIRTVQQGDITLLAPRGGVNAGALGGSTGVRAADLGVLTVAGGDIAAIVGQSFEVNQSRVFTLKQGGILIWASEGNIDAGRGAKTVTGAPPPTLVLDSQGRLVLDTSGSFSGSGIAVLDANSALDLYAPQGEINAGEAGIRSVGQAFFATLAFRGADDIKVGAGSTGGPPVVAAPSTAGLSAQASATAAGTRSDSDDEDEKRKRRRARRNLLLDFLGFGSER